MRITYCSPWRRNTWGHRMEIYEDFPGRIRSGDVYRENCKKLV